MDELDGHRPVADCRCNSLDGLLSSVAGDEDARNAGLEEEGVALEWPAPYAAVRGEPHNLRSGEHKTALAACHEVADPIGSRNRTDEDEHGRRHQIPLAIGPANGDGQACHQTSTSSGAGIPASRSS